MMLRFWVVCALMLFPAGAQAAERILALTPHVCEILYAVGAGPEVVGAGEYCNFPPAVKSLPRVANYRQLYVEAALRLHPTLAIGLRDNLPGLDRLRDAGVRTASSNPVRVQQVLDDMLRIGRLAGHAAEAGKAVEQLTARLQALRMQAIPGHPRVYYEIWHEPLMAAGGGSLIGDVIGELGMVNVFAGLPMEGPRVSVESVLLARPDIIMLSSEADVAAREAFWRHWFGKNTPRFVIADADLLHRPGPRLVEGMEHLQAAVRQAMQETREPSHD